MIRIEIKDTAIRTKSGTSARTGKAYSINEQQGWAFIMDRDGKPNPYPSKIAINLDDRPAYPPGVYSIADESFYANRFGQLELNLILCPFVAEAATPHKKAA